MAIPDVLELAHLLVKRSVETGDIAIDATVGNGHDTLHLAQQVGATGKVVGFDVQVEAIEATRSLLKSANAPATVHLVCSGHEKMKEHVNEEDQGAVGAVMFNLGYLPGGNKQIKTRPESTRKGLWAAVDLLRPGGVITVVAYSGHEGGTEEVQVVESWVSSLAAQNFQCISYRFLNSTSDPPELYAIEKREDRH